MISVLVVMEHIVNFVKVHLGGGGGGDNVLYIVQCVSV